MCYSAQIWAGYKRYVRAWGAEISIAEFVRIYWLREHGEKVRIPKGMDTDFTQPTTDDERSIQAMIEAHDARQASALETEVFAQRKRLANAERTLQAKTTKAATESKRIASDKIARALSRLQDLRRSETLPRDSRIYPGWYAPVMVWENGRRVVKPMRYQCRPAGKPAFYDTRYPGAYNARRDNLTGFWREQFGFSHGVMVANAFYENVSRHAMEHRELAPGEKEQNVVLEFRPQPQEDMLVACLWSRWEGADETLLSFAAITDEPPPEVAAAGHDRCIVPIKPANVDAWLRAGPNLAAMQAILDDRARPYYEHRLAA